MYENNTKQNCHRFSNVDVAARYPDRFRSGHPRDERELRMIELALDYLPAGAGVLDLPCGSGRVSRVLLSRGYQVHCADLSPSMLQQARQNLCGDPPSIFTGQRPGFSQQDLVNGTSFADQQFDASLCHRLFHHLIDEASRIRALCELARTSRDFVVFSFFDRSSFGARLKALRNIIRGHVPTDRIPIGRDELARESRAAKLEIIEYVPARQGISPLTMAVARPIRVS